MDRYQTDQNKGNNNSVVEGREKFILGIIIGTVVTSLTVFIATDYNENYTNIWSLLIIAIIIFCILAIIIVFFKETLLKKFLKITFPPYKEIANNSANLFENLALGNKLASISSAKLVVNLLVNYHFWIKLRNWTIGANIALLAIIGGFFISMLTLAQNTLLNTQNQIEEKQLIIDNSLKYNQFEGIYKLVNRIYSEKNIQGGLSKELISDIIKITNSLIPYKYMDREGKIKSNLSEEKGILLKALIEANLSEFDYENIFRYSNFSNTDLSYFNSNRKVTLKNINLSHSHISNCRLRNITFDSIICNSLNFSNCAIDSSSFSNLIQVDYLQISETKITNSIFNNTNFANWNFSQSHFFDNNYKKVKTDKIKFIDSQIDSTLYLLFTDTLLTEFEIQHTFNKKLKITKKEPKKPR